MTGRTKSVLAVVACLSVAGAIGLEITLDHGFSARDEPTAMEKLIARRLRSMSVPRAHSLAQNPPPLTAEALDRARAHFADHCATCHGNDGRGRTALGQNLYPKSRFEWEQAEAGKRFLAGEELPSPPSPGTTHRH